MYEYQIGSAIMACDAILGNKFKPLSVPSAYRNGYRSFSCPGRVRNLKKRFAGLSHKSLQDMKTQLLAHCKSPDQSTYLSPEYAELVFFHPVAS